MKIVAYSSVYFINLRMNKISVIVLYTVRNITNVEKKSTNNSVQSGA